MAVSRGTARLGPEGLVLTAPDASGTTIVTLTTSLRSSNYPVIAWQSSGVPDNVEAALLWGAAITRRDACSIVALPSTRDGSSLSRSRASGTGTGPSVA